MIEDDELRELFGTESEEHLQMLDDGLLRLETNPNDKSTLEEVFRAAHSLKGTARMLGVTGVETIAHHMEEELGSVRRGRGTLTSAHIDRYSVGLSAMRGLVQEAISDTRADVDVNRVLAQLSGEIPIEIAPKRHQLKRRQKFQFQLQLPFRQSLSLHRFSSLRKHLLPCARSNADRTFAR
jgi:two-component system chemotaxis sensor kinase CheA